RGEPGRQLQRLQRQAPSAQKAGQSMQQAGQSLAQSSQSLSQNQQQNAQQQQQQAMQAMQNAMQSLEQAMAEAGQNDDPFAELRKRLTELATQERGVQAATRRIDDEAKRDGVQDPQRREMAQLASKQDEIKGASGVLEKELP